MYLNYPEGKKRGGICVNECNSRVTLSEILVLKLKPNNTTNKSIGETRIKQTNVKNPKCIKVIAHFEDFPGTWTALQQHQEHSEGIPHNGAKNWTRRNEMRKMLVKKQNMHEINILANLCCDIDFEDFPGIWSALQQQQDHSEGILHNGAKNWTRRNEMRKMLFKKQNRVGRT